MPGGRVRSADDDRYRGGRPHEENPRRCIILAKPAGIERNYHDTAPGTVITLERYQLPVGGIESRYIRGEVEEQTNFHEQSVRSRLGPQ